MSVQVPLSLRKFINMLLVLALAGAALSGALAAIAEQPPPVRILMLEAPGCRYCAAWDAEVGRGYALSAEGQFAPIQRVRRGAPELAQLTKPATYTPTFIVMKGETEAGRITGYPGQFYFWEELKEILTTVGFKTPAP